MTELDDNSYPCPDCEGTITFEHSPYAYCESCGYYLSSAMVQFHWTIEDGWDYQRTDGQRCSHLGCARSDDAGEYYCEPTRLPQVLISELSGSNGDIKCWPNRALASAVEELGQAIKLVHSEIGARGSSVPAAYASVSCAEADRLRRQGTKWTGGDGPSCGEHFHFGTDHYAWQLPGLYLHDVVDDGGCRHWVSASDDAPWGAP